MSGPLQKPGEKPRRPGEYEERGRRGGKAGHGGEGTSALQHLSQHPQQVIVHSCQHRDACSRLLSAIALFS